MQCDYFDAGLCRSCTLMGVPYGEQLAAKEAHCREQLAGHEGIAWLPAVASTERGFRNKAKMVVGGTADAPTLGILGSDGHGVDLQRCGVCDPGLHAAFPALVDFIRLARIQPYDVPARRGELKNLLVTISPDGELMVRFVLRSQESLSRIRKHLPTLLAALPNLAVASVNLQPEHKAVLEGDEEIPLTEQRTLRMRVNDVELDLRSRSFFQTNTPIAAALYAQAREWVAETAPASVWDLYCGVGGFALHLSAPGREVVGIETSAEAVRSAERSAAAAGLTGTRFLADDATAFALASTAPPELVLVNPPRRGIGTALAEWLERSGVERVVYSSCNAVTLGRDLRSMPSLRPTRARVLDMFPQTNHYEAITLLERA